jgi:hypothetical protein
LGLPGMFSATTNSMRGGSRLRRYLPESRRPTASATPTGAGCSTSLRRAHAAACLVSRGEPWSAIQRCVHHREWQKLFGQLGTAGYLRPADALTRSRTCGHAGANRRHCGSEDPHVVSWRATRARTE